MAASSSRPPIGRLRCSVDELRTLFLFEKLTDEQLDWLCENGHVEYFEPGPVYTEGDPATCFYVLLDGTLVLSRRVGVDDVETTRTSQRGVYAGAMRAYLGNNAPDTYNGSMRVTEPSRFFVLDAPTFAKVMADWFPMAVHLLEGLFYGIKNTNEVIGQRERLLALGSLSAGLTHELNNPASAAVRATSALRDRVAGMRHKLGMIVAGKFPVSAMEPLIELQESGRRAGREGARPDPDGGQRPRGRDRRMVGGPRDPGRLGHRTDLRAGRPRRRVARPGGRHGAGRHSRGRRSGGSNYTVETELLMNEIHDSTTRISTLVGAAKQYSQMDRAPFQTVDVHELLDSTLTMLSGKIGADHGGQGLRPHACRRSRPTPPS